MAHYKCPACGAAYNGKRCRICYYEHFTEEISHRNHTHRGEPLVIRSPVRKPIRSRDPFACDEETRNRLPKILKLLIPLGIMLLSLLKESLS